MLCISPGSSELRTRLIKAARGFVGFPKDGSDFSRLTPVFSACRLFELCSSHFNGSGACFCATGVEEMGRKTWYGLETVS